MDWFEVDKQGLAKILERRGKAFAVFELIQNAWDTAARNVRVSITPIPGRPEANLVVEDDDPEGFRSLAHAWTLFAESEKKAHAEKRGRFNLGEKLVLALCETAEISTTTGTVKFGPEGRTQTRGRTACGSVVRCTLRMTRADLAEVEAAVRTLIPPAAVVTTFNGEQLVPCPLARDLQVTLPTEIADEHGVLRLAKRRTLVTIHEVREGETAKLYELGIPVVETGDRWHVNVHQKVPLTLERDNVSPAYLRAVRVAVLNAMHDEVRGEAATAPWVREAAGDPRATPEAVKHVLTERYGERRVIADPTDPEGTKLAVAQGYAVIHGGSLSAGEWANVKASGAALPAGQVTPSPKPYAPGGEPFEVVKEPTPAMLAMAAFAKALAEKLFGATIDVTLADCKALRALATYGPRNAGRGGSLVLNAAHLGPAWFERGRRDRDVLSLLVHEFGHHSCRDHLSEEYHDALCRLGARLVCLALEEPAFFAPPGMERPR